MTLNALAKDAADERDAGPAVLEADFQSARVGAGGTVAPTRASPRRSPTSIVDRLTRFFPVEVMSLYLPGVATIQSHMKDAAAGPLLWLYIASVAATPLIVWLLFVSRLIQTNKPVPAGPPWRRMLMGLVSFAAWGASVPGIFPAQQWFLGWIALLVATLLPEVDAVLARKPQ
jgi:hypothetical protein